MPELYKHSGHEIGPDGMIIQILQFGRNYTGEIADTMRVGRNRFQASTAYEAVLLHPSFYYYPTLPTRRCDYNTLTLKEVLGNHVDRLRVEEYCPLAHHKSAEEELTETKADSLVNAAGMRYRSIVVHR